ncbi:hypothetical protein FRC17_010346 [Serendipita sp. 399]|nr:hypothetical protein FRC17_010346 [Serendipita sp. 399]
MPVSPRRSTTPPPPPRPPKPPELEYHPNGQSALTGAKQSAEHDAVSAMPNTMPMERQAPAELSVRAGDIGEISSAIPHGPARTEISLVDATKSPNLDMINAAERQLQNPPIQGTSLTDSQTQRPATMDSGNYYARGIDDPSQSGIAGIEADSPPPYEQVSAMEMAGSTRESNTEVLREAVATLSTTNENGLHFSSITRLSSPSPPPVFRNHSISLHEPITTATVVPHAPSGIVTTQTILSPLEASSVRLSPTDGGGSLSPSGSSQAGPLNTRDHWVAPVLSDEPGPAIITSPPTPSPSHSPTNHTLSPAFSGPSRPSRRFTVSSTDSPRSVTSSSDSDDPFQDPPTFQQDSSPFAPTKVDMFHPTHVGAAESYFASNHTMIAPFNNGETAAPGNWAHDSAISAAWPATGAPSTPYSEAGSNEVHRPRANTAKSFPRSPVEGLLTNSFVSHSPTSTQPESSTDTPGAKDAKRWSNRISRPSSSSRMSMFFRSSSTTNAQGNTPDGLSPSRSTFGRKSGIDLLGDSTISDERESYMNEGLQQESSLDPGSHDQQTAPGPSLQLSPLDVWNGIGQSLHLSVHSLSDDALIPEFGFRSPNWQSPPRVGSDQRLRWHDNITLYPTGSDPFFIRAPSWRLLLRFLASQSTTRIEPSVEALATSRNPTLDLRLVMQFVRTPYAPKGSSRDVCLYFMLHTEMPAAHTKSGRSIPTAERLATEHWDTSVLPYSFVCGDSSLLRKQRTNTGETCTSKHTGCKCTPIDLQDPDGANSMFVTLPPPFIRLPVNLSAVAMYLHESFVLSRRHGKGKGIQEGPIRADSDRSSKMRKFHHGENSGERIDLGPHDSKLTSGNANVPGSPGSLQISGDRPDLSPRSIAPSQVPGIKRLAKAIKTFYPDEYALGSSRSNAAAHAGVQDDRLPKEKRMNVANTNKHGGANKGGLLGTLSRIKGKSSVAKHAVAELGAAASLGSHTRRDTNEERYELVTPWTMRND